MAGTLGLLPVQEQCEWTGDCFLSKKSANGQDLTVLGVQELTQDMRMSNFGARKVIALRDAFLGSPLV